ncbi:OmpH/Skp family outer membrane protein [Halovulum sp. GXIMD14793]
MAGWRRFLLAVALLLPGAALAQPLLTVELENVLQQSEYGKSVLEEEASRIDALRQRGREIDSNFESEELRLTEQRATLPAEEFRKLADEFDARVIATRAELQQLGRALEQENQRRRQMFFNNVTPILVGILEETGATAIVEHRALLVARQDLNITQEVIKRLDQAYRAGQVPTTDDPPPDEERNEDQRQE